MRWRVDQRCREQAHGNKRQVYRVGLRSMTQTKRKDGAAPQQISGAVRKSRWPSSWATVPNKPTVFVDIKQYSTKRRLHPQVSHWRLLLLPISSHGLTTATVSSWVHLILSSSLSIKFRTLLQDLFSWHPVTTTQHLSWKNCTGKWEFQNVTY